MRRGVMCTVIFLRRPGATWPLILGANRDEMTNRPWRPPARHWPDRPEVVAGIDDLAGGTWFGLNDHGVVAGVLNRTQSLGPAPGKRSRGELVLEALDHADAVAAAEAFAALDGHAYRPFNLFVADNETAYWMRHAGRADGRIEIFPIPEGLSLLTARDLNDSEAPRIRNFRPRFEAARAPDPARSDWADWAALLSSGDQLAGHGPDSALAIVTDFGFGTTSSTLLALPSAERPELAPVWRFAPGLPRPERFAPVDISSRATPGAVVSAGRH